MRHQQMIEILLVDDDEADVWLTLESFKASKIANRITVCSHGQEALELLEARSANDESLPDLILLDINMPVMDGFGFLKEIKARSGMRSLPVVVLTTSSDDEEILRSYDLQASSFISKPVDVACFFEIVKAIDDYWFSIVRLPARNKSNARN